MILKKEHIVEYIGLINLQFPNAYNLKCDRDRIMLVELWYEGLKNYPKELCDIAVKNSILKAEFAPKISTIVTEVENIIASQRDSDSDLWSKLIKSLNKISHKIPYTNDRYDFYVHYDTGLTTAELARKGIAEEYNNLPPEIREYCGNIRGFMDLAQTSEENLQYEKGRFLKQIPLLRERIKTRQNTPKQLADMIQGLLKGEEQKLIEVKNGKADH